MISNGFFDIIKEKGERKMKRKTKIICIILAAVLVCFAAYFLNPELRVKCFVAAHSDNYENWDGVPANIGIKYSNRWGGEHGMHEMVLFTFGGTNYGCYYSPDDVPLAFQNMDFELVQEDKETWTWSDNGNIHGETSKIKDNWYYFEATY